MTMVTGRCRPGDLLHLARDPSQCIAVFFSVRHVRGNDGYGGWDRMQVEIPRCKVFGL